MMQSDRHPLRKALQRIFRRRQQKRQRVLRHFEIMESRVLLAADLQVAFQDSPMLELHGEYSSIATASPVAEGESAIVAEGEAAQDLVAFAKALAASGTRFYGAAWCPHCTATKELFEDGADFLSFIEVTNLDSPVTLNAVGSGTNTTLNPSGVPINSFPTWEFPDGSRLEGEQTLATISQRSGVAIVSSDQPFIAPIDDGDINSSDVDADGDEIVTLLGGSPLHIALDGYDPGGGPLTYTVTSSNPSVVSTTLLQNDRSMVIDVAGWGKMNIHLFEQLAPRPTSRLIQLAESGDYAGVPFHRIVNGFVIQGGDITNGNGTGGSTLGDFDDQYNVRLQHNRTGVLSYAKSGDDTNDSQFFITEVATRSLDGNHSIAGILVEGDKNREAISNNSTANPRSVVMNSVDIITDTENAVVMLSAAEGASGSAQITVTATDANGNAVSRAFTVNVTPDTIDTFAWLDDVADVTVAVGQSSTKQISAKDVENATVRFRAITPANFTINLPLSAVAAQSQTATASMSITPIDGFVGTESITLFAYNPQHSIAQVRNSLGQVIRTVDLTSPSLTFNDLLAISASVDYQTITAESESSSTGTITGIVFSDTDRDGVLDTGEVGLSGFVVFSDSNGNGLNDPGEVTATTALDGTYSLALSAGQHTIRQVAVANVLETTTNPVTLDLQSGEVITDVRFGTFEVKAPTLVDLLAVTDSGNGTDNITNFNNSAVDRALQFQVGGVVDGATVRLFSDGVLIGQGTANGGITITTNGATTLANGTHSIIATQEVDGVQGPASASLTITIDATPPGAFTSTAPTGAIVGNDISYDANSVDEGNGITYSLSTAPQGATINAATGFLSWAPTASQLEQNDFAIVATDVAGNTTQQQLAVRVTNQPIVGASFKITADASPDSAEIGEVTVGDTFFLHVSVTDLRDNARGTFGFYEDITFDSLLAAGRNITYSPTFPNVQAGSILGGEIDEVGAVNFDTNGVGPGTFHIFSVEFKATRSGTLNLVGNAPDVVPSHDVLVLGINQAVPSDEILFGATQLTINPSFGANDDIFNFDEDSINITLDVLANDSALSGSTANLVITSISPQVTGVSIASDGKSLRYSPAGNFNGEITFDYTVSDGVDDLTANVTVQIHPINDAPVAANDTAVITAGTSNNFINVLGNDTDIDGDQLKVQSVGQLTGNGTISVASNGSGLNYTPGTGFTGVDTATYTITDNRGGTAQATLTLTVTGAGGDLFTVDEGSLDNVFDVLQNDTGSGLTITAVGSTSRGGIVTIIESGQKLNYSRPANDNFFGAESFTYTSRASNGQVSTGTVIVTVNNTNDPPTAVNDTLTVTQGSTGNTLNVLANDSNAPDPVGETLTVVSVDGSSTIGSLSLVNGVVRYSAPTSFPATGLATGTDTFTYTIDDGSGLTSQATATVNVVDFIPGSLSGFVYVDSDNDGVRDTGEEAFEGVTISLSGTNDFGSAVTRQTTTASNGAYTFAGLAPGNYMISETQPTGVRNGVPIVDGKDTIGSQGGAVSANDQFSITLTEGTMGIDNNFAELLGRTLSGLIRNQRVAEFTDIEVFGGLELLLIEMDTVVTSGSGIASAFSTGGSFNYDAIAPGSYRLFAPTPAFLLSNEASVFTATVTAEADSTGNLVAIRGREAAFISLRDISTASPTEFAHVAVGSSGQEWYSFGRGWEGFTDANFSLTNGGVDLHIEVTAATGQTSATDVARSDPRLRVLGQKNGLDLVQLMAGSAAFDLQVVSPANGNGASGEGSTVASQATIAPAVTTASVTVPVVAAVTSTPVSGSPEGESSTNAIGDVQVYQPVVGRPIQAPTPIEPVTTTTSTTELQIPVIPSRLLVTNDGQTVSMTSTVDLSFTDDSEKTDDVTDEMRAALLVEVADEYGDPFRYGASSGSEFVPLEEDLHEGAEEKAEVLPEDLLDQLANDVATI
ncbi:MAG: tandem-95 repeat protein [Planctomycetota bacterium]|nr:tandem-95 repeat protein [Planctomycetota bacterium]